MALIFLYDESAPSDETNVGIPHMVGSEHDELRGWLGIQSLRRVRKRTCCHVYRAYSVTCRGVNIAEYMLADVMLKADNTPFVDVMLSSFVNPPTSWFAVNNVSVTDTPFAIPFTTSLEVMVIAGGHVPHMMGKWVWVRADWSKKSVGNEDTVTL